MVTILNSLFRAPQGYLVIDDPDPRSGVPRTVEMTTCTCGHCGALKQIKAMCPPEEMPITQCYGCRRHICIACAQEMDRTGKCDEIERELERWEAADRLYRAC
jgi:hypothetical protein